MSFPILFAVLINSGCSVPEPAGTRGEIVREVIDSRFDSYLQKMVTKEHFTGAALVMREGEVIHAKGYGSATGDRANGVNTKFHVGSITKQLTAAAIMQLVER